MTPVAKMSSQVCVSQSSPLSLSRRMVSYTYPDSVVPSLVIDWRDENHRPPLTSFCSTCSSTRISGAHNNSNTPIVGCDRARKISITDSSTRNGVSKDCDDLERLAQDCSYMETRGWGLKLGDSHIGGRYVDVVET
jgi:hypothetical protein